MANHEREAMVAELESMLTSMGPMENPDEAYLPVEQDGVGAEAPYFAVTGVEQAVPGDS